MLDVALKHRASDIHFQPLEHQGVINFRIDGYLSLWQKVPFEQFRAMITRLKFLSNMDVGEMRAPQDGALQYVYRENRLQLRLATMPTVFGEKLVIRIFPPQHEDLPLERLGFTPGQFQLLSSLIQLPYGTNYRTHRLW